MSRHTRKIWNILKYNSKMVNEIVVKINEYKNEEVVAIYNPEHTGVMNSTKDLFENTIGIKEIFNQKQVEQIAIAINDNNISQVVFSGNTLGWKALIEKIRDINDLIKIKFLWHGNHSLFVNRDEPYFLYSIIELLDRNIINSVGFAKESMANYYKLKGYNSYFVPNNIMYNLKDKMNSSEINKYAKIDEKKYVGLYSAGNRWEKNTYNQLSAISMLKESIVDVLPTNELTKSFCDLMNIKVNNNKLNYLPRNELLYRMSQNDINLYVTFSECSPVVPLESLELGVPCLTGNNHHYFKGEPKLYDYLVVQSEDNIDEILSKMKKCIANKEEIISLYKKWKNKYDIFCKEKISEFINS